MNTEDIIDKHYRQMNLVYGALLEDVSKHKEIMLSNPSAMVWRRSIVRASFAFIEGAAASMRRFLVFLEMVRDDDLKSMDNADDLFDSYGIRIKSGKKGFLSFPESVKKTLKLLATACRVEYSVGDDSNGWMNFLEATKIRDRITHPKSPECLMLTDAELVKVAKAAAWYIDSFVEIIDKWKAKRNEK